MPLSKGVVDLCMDFRFNNHDSLSQRCSKCGVEARVGIETNQEPLAHISYGTKGLELIELVKSG